MEQKDLQVLEAEAQKFCQANSINFDKLIELKKIGGHKQYHLEGDAFTHTLLVWDAARERFHGEKICNLMEKVALLHDIGKIYTAQPDAEFGNVYPNHSPKGAEVLENFYSTMNKDFSTIRWYVRNHIKPLFWKEWKDATKIFPATNDTYLYNLGKLGLCDLEGSKPLNMRDWQQNHKLLEKIVLDLEIRNL